MFSLVMSKNEGKEKCCEICFENELNKISSNLIKCSNCGFTIHKECYFDSSDYIGEEFINNESWLCDRCKYEQINGNIPLVCKICHTNVYLLLLYFLLFSSQEKLE